jgi:glucokinase
LIKWWSRAAILAFNCTIVHAPQRKASVRYDDDAVDVSTLTSDDAYSPDDYWESVMTEAPLVAAIDIGGTTLKAALTNREGAEVFTERRPTGREHGWPAVIENILTLAEDLVTVAEQRTGHKPGALAVACLGIVDERAGVAVFSAALGWRDVALRELLVSRVGLPVTLLHDLRAGAVAEARLGAGRSCEQFLFVAIGTGIGGAIVVDGKPFVGASGSAGEIGHIVIRPGGRRCGCGAHGCLETEASASAIAAVFSEITGRSASAREVASAAAAGDPQARVVWAGAVDALAAGLCASAVLLGATRIVVGGGLALAGRTLFEPLQAAVTERFTLPAVPEVVPAQLGDRAGCLGAGLLAWQLASG